MSTVGSVWGFDSDAHLTYENLFYRKKQNDNKLIFIFGKEWTEKDSISLDTVVYKVSVSNTILSPLST